MLNSISWEQYLIIVASLLFIYYLGVILLYYRSDLSIIFSTDKITSSKKEIEPRNYSQSSDKVGSLMGAIQKDEEKEEDEDKTHVKKKEEIGEADTASVGAITTENEPTGDSEPPHPSPGTVLLGSVADLLQETKSMIELHSENNGSKEDLIKFLGGILDKNISLKSTSYRDTISLYIFNEASGRISFELSLDEVKALWN